MVEKFILRNSKINKEIVISELGDSNYALESVDWGSVSASHNTYKSLNQIGSAITSTNLQERTITITGYLFAIADFKIIESFSEQKLFDYRQKEVLRVQDELGKIINPQHVLDILVKDFTISGKPTESPSFGKSYVDNNEVRCKFQFSIFCNEPMFKYKERTETVLSGKTTGYHFPISIPKTTGMIFGLRKSYQLVVVENLGDIALGGQIILESNGDVINPSLTDVFTGQTIKFHGTLHDGERIEINTEDFHKSAIKIVNNVETNYFNSWDITNDWIQFSVGSSLLGFTADSESYKNLDVKVIIRIQQYSFGGM